MEKPIWTNTTKHLLDLVPWERNPRVIDADEAKRLQESFNKFGQTELILIGPNNELYNGHQRLQTWLKAFGNIVVEVRQSNRELTEQEREEYTILAHVGATGHLNWDALSSWPAGAWMQWGRGSCLLVNSILIQM